MKALAFGNRLARDLGGDSIVDMAADTRLEILDAINAALQKLHALASHESKVTTASIYLPAPSTVTLGVTTGSAVVTGHTFTSEDLYRTIRLDGDDIDNQVISDDELLHPYAGPTGTVSAVIYSDAATVPEPYDELIANPMLLEKRRELLPGKPDPLIKRPICEPRYYQVEANARNQNPPAPSVIRLDSLPGSAYRLQVKFSMAPASMSFADILSSSTDVPIREEHVELYLLPIARGILTTSDKWKNGETRGAVKSDAETAEARFSALAPRTLATPSNFAGTPTGF